MLDVSKDYKNAVYTLVRKITARISFTIDDETNIYDDTIIDLKILEEMNTINTTLPSNEIQVTLDNTSRAFDFLNLQNIQNVLAKKPKIKAEFGLELVNGMIEYVPMGSFTLIEWKNETGSMSVSLIGRDSFDLLKEVSYHNTDPGTLYDLAVDIFERAEITDYEIDDSLKAIHTEGFTERIDSRTALQHIGIASKSAVFQDRNGVVFIKPFKVLDQSDNFLVYCGQPNVFAGVTIPAVDVGYDMKHIDYDNIFKEPDISLDKSIYEVVVNVYESNNKREVIYINSAISGNNGASFQIDNPLINNETLAKEVAEWIIRESNINAVYKTIWRQNPVLECGDVILVEDAFDAKRQTRIVKQEFEYRGFLRGVTESRGGL
ncbi:hypothetical protein V1503_24935 [Bacillus sp. SCS-151]|uniref:hypothetical protein n=1 Tax=Nanhaiella sioensis TaxID=3115293 RepID=UPI003979EF23